MRRFTDVRLLSAALLLAGIGVLAPAAAQEAPPEPVYRGRAIFEPVTPPIVPEAFRGKWTDAAAGCGKGNALSIKSDSVTLSDKRRKVLRVLLRPDQEPPARDAILELVSGEAGPQVLILSQTPEGSLRLRIRGSEQVRIFLRCPVRR